MRVVKNVANEGELVACVARNGETEVELSLAEPTRGSLLLLFCPGRQRCGGAFSAPHLRVLGNLDRDLRLIPVYREGLRLTLCLLKCCTKPTRIASVIAESSLVTSAHLWWSRTATTLLGSADVLDFNVPHVSSCCQQAKAGSALERRRSTGSGELIWRILDAFGMAVAVPAAAVGAFYWWRPKRVATIPRLRRG
jgi:hypothetical protein